MSTTDSDRVREWMNRALNLWPGLEKERSFEYERVLGAVCSEVSAHGFWQRLPRLLRAEFASRGWAWNGIYARTQSKTLTLVAAAGPPVCSALEGTGVLGASGMCWDAVLSGRTLWANDVKQWPGYVSCDNESGLRTVSGLVCPLRDRAGAVLGVWDLDCTENLLSDDVLFMDALLGTLTAVLLPDLAQLTGDREG